MKRETASPISPLSDAHLQREVIREILYLQRVFLYSELDFLVPVIIENQITNRRSSSSSGLTQK